MQYTHAQEQEAYDATWNQAIAAVVQWLALSGAAAPMWEWSEEYSKEVARRFLRHRQAG